MMFLTNPQVAITVVEKFAALTLFISGLEYLTEPKQLMDDGLISWRIGSLRQSWLAGGPVGKALDRILSYPSVLGIIAVYTLLAGVILVGPPDLIIQPWIILPLVAALGVLFLRSNYGYDGADQLAWIIFTGLAPVSIIATPTTQTIFLWFVALQVSLAYGVAGIAKATAKGWWNGSYLIEILGTQIYGRATIATLMRRNPLLSTLHSCFVILWECSFLFILFLPYPVVLVFIAAGVVFHLLNAYVMGLNTFVWSFIAAYPALLFCVQTRGW